ncbi:MAG: sulfate transporter CysZ [Gammaproteobacteria bacterium]|nr:sulfate transporter CysZ [Gammaproteobacteria bacterium]
MTGFFAGARFFLRGYELIRQRGLRRYAAIPLLINVVIFVALTIVGANQFEQLMQWLLPEGQGWWIEVLRAVLWIMFAAIVVVAFYFLFTLVANLVASPFNGLLADKVQISLGSVPPDGRNWLSVIRGFPAALVSESRKLAYFLLIGVILVLISLVPAVNLAGIVLWPLATAWMLTLEYVAYPMESCEHDFRSIRARARANRMMALGFGLTCLLFTIIPLINLFVIPAAVAGASAMWAESWSRNSG